MLARVIGGLTIANFMGFGVIALYLGGDALNGYAENGRFYLSMYGRPREVSEAVFTYSKWHAYSVVASFAAVIVWQLLSRNRKLGHA